MGEAEGAVEVGKAVEAAGEGSLAHAGAGGDEFPAGGVEAHLIDEGTQAYAKTEPPEPEPAVTAAPAASKVQPQVFSQWAPVKNLFFIAVGYLWEEHKGPVIAWGVLAVCALVLLGVAIAS